MHLVIHHRREPTVNFSKCPFVDDNEIYTSSAHIFLSSSINHIETIEVNLAAQDIAAHVGDEWNAKLFK